MKNQPGDSYAHDVYTGCTRNTKNSTDCTSTWFRAILTSQSDAIGTAHRHGTNTVLPAMARQYKNQVPAWGYPAQKKRRSHTTTLSSSKEAPMEFGNKKYNMKHRYVQFFEEKTCFLHFMVILRLLLETNRVNIEKYPMLQMGVPSPPTFLRSTNAQIL